MNLEMTCSENENCRCKVPTDPTHKVKFILSDIKSVQCCKLQNFWLCNLKEVTVKITVLCMVSYDIVWYVLPSSSALQMVCPYSWGLLAMLCSFASGNVVKICTTIRT